MVGARNAYRLLTFRHLFKYKDLKLRVPNGFVAQRKDNDNG